MLAYLVVILRERSSGRLRDIRHNLIEECAMTRRIVGWKRGRMSRAHGHRASDKDLAAPVVKIRHDKNGGRQDADKCCAASSLENVTSVRFLATRTIQIGHD